MNRHIALGLAGLCALGAFSCAPQARADVSDHLVAEWKFDETTAGDTAADSIGSNDAAPTGNPQPSTDVPPVSFDDPRSLSFDGTNYVTYLNPVSTDFTICAWVKTTSTGGGTSHWTSAPILDAETSGVGLDFGFGVGNGGKLMFGNGGRPYNDPVSGSLYDTQVNGNTTINDGEWHNVCASRNDTTGEVKLYVDAHLDGSGVTGVGPLTRNPNARTAYGYDGAAMFVGNVDDLRVYDTVLSDAQLGSLAAGNDNPDALSPSALSPSDDATGVDTGTDLSLTFGTTTVATSTGAIGLYRTADDSLAESFPLDGPGIARSETGDSTVFTLTPASPLAESTGYYLSVASTTFEDGAGSFWTGTTASTSWNFTTGDFTAPVISAVATSSVTDTGAGVSWTTDEAASTRVAYGLTADYSAYTTETDTSPRVTSHAATLSSLLPCTTYHYAAVSRDAAGNTATSADATFATTGCGYDATPASSSSGTVDANSTATTTLSDGGKDFSVGATATSSSLVIQIQAVPSDPVLEEFGTPAASPSAVGVHVFDVKAIMNGDTILDSFDTPVTITYAYDESDIAGLDESTLTLYHYHGGAWVPLDDCTVDASANTITCTTPSFSVFALFGSPLSSSSHSASHPGTSIQNQVANLAAMGKTVEADALKKEWYWLFPSTAQAAADAVPATSAVRDLQLGMTGTDVLALQKLLNANGSPLAASGVGSTGNETDYFGSLTQAALAKYQSANGIAPAVGYFGPLTRAQMKTASLAAGLWW